MFLVECMFQLKDKTNYRCAMVSLVLFLVSDIVMLVNGAIAKDECPIQEKIPIYLIVAGATGILSKILLIINLKLDWLLIYIITQLSYAFSIGWAIAGSIWVYSIYQPNYNKENGPFCSETAYRLTLAMLTLRWMSYVGIVILLICVCCFCWLKDKLSRKSDLNDVDERS